MKTYSLALRLSTVMLLAMPAFCRADVIDIGTLGGAYTQVYGVNSSGQVVGWSLLASGEPHAFLYEAGVMTDLGTLGGPSSVALAINEAGQIAGASDTADGQGHVFLYDGGIMSDLGTLGGSGISGAGAWPWTPAMFINSSGQIAGTCADADGAWRAFLYSGGTMRDVGLPGIASYAAHLNESGQVTGTFTVITSTGDWIDHAFFYNGSATTDLGALGYEQSRAVALDDAGNVVGEMFKAGHPAMAFLYSGGEMRKLPTLGSNNNQPNDMNASGEIAGYSTVSQNMGYAYVTTNGIIQSIGVANRATTSYAYHLNNAGQVTGYLAYIPADRSGRWWDQPFLYSHGVMRPLAMPSGDFGRPVAISEAGHVAGVYAASSAFAHSPRTFLRSPECGDGIWDLGEECDDGNTASGDCCASDCTYPGPATTCLPADNASLTLSDISSDKLDKISWRWRGGPGFAQPDLGNPASSTTYQLCISDSTAGVDRLVASMIVGPNASWTSTAPDGWKYKDRVGYEAGVVKATLQTGADGQSSVKLVAKGAAVPMPAPVSDSKFFDMGPRVTAQLFNSATSTCWSSEFTAAKANTALRFRAP